MGNDTSVNAKGPKPAHGRPHSNHGGSLPSNARLMNTAIKQRLSKGNNKSTYNMKVVIRGDRQTGKSALFHRLEGGGFIKEHRVTDQIQCSHVLWPYKTSDEMVNLEIWDVVDKAIIPTNIVDDNNGIIKPSTVSKNLLPADASTIDVYKGAHAVIFMVDPTRKWTLDYVKTNISKIPDGIDCVVLFGKKDLNKLWTLTNGEIEEFMSSQPKNVRQLQISLQDCYGMKELHSFFNVPFLRMKAKYLQQELQRAEREYEQSKVELDIFINHQNYDEFLARLKALKDQKSNRKSKAPSSPVTAPAPKVKQTVRSSKDLPLFQEQQQKEEAKKKEEEEKKKEEIKKLDNIDSFKPTGGLNDDFFADLGGDDDIDDDDKSDEDDDENRPKPSKPRPIQMPDNDDNEEEEDNNEQEGENHAEGIQPNGHNKDNSNINKEKEDNDKNNGPGFGNDDNDIGFADSELNDTKEIINGHSDNNKKEKEDKSNSKPEKMAYSRMPDLKVNNDTSSISASKSNGKLQSLMKLQAADIEESDSDEYDDEPLVFAAPKTITKPKAKPKPQPIKQKPKPKIKSMKMAAINLDINDGDKNEDDKEKEDKQKTENNDNNKERQEALDAFLNDLSNAPQSPVSPKSPKSNDDEELDEDEAERKRRKEEKKRRKKEKKKRKKERRKEKKRKKKELKKQKEKDNDLVEYDDSNDSDDIVEIE